MTKEDLDLFRSNLIKTREMTLPIQTALTRLNNFLDTVRTAGVVADALDPIRREVRQCKSSAEDAVLNAQSQADNLAVLAGQGQVGDALAAVNTALISIQTLTKPLFAIRDRLTDVRAKSGPVLLETLQAHNFDDELEAWKDSLDEWTRQTMTATWTSARAS